MKLLNKVGALLALLVLLSAALGQGSSQNKEEEICSGPVYKAREVTRKAKITHVDEPTYTEEAKVKGVRGRVVLGAVLCSAGKVTNIEVIEGLPYGLTENAVESTRNMQFEPAEKEGQAVSQYIRRECNFNLF